MLSISYTRDCGYYIKRGSSRNSDLNIAKFLEIRIKEYYKMLRSFNAHYHKEYREYFFEYENDAQKFCNYLNDKYILMMKLTEQEKEEEEC